MSVVRKSIEVEVVDIKFGRNDGAVGWFASARIVATDLDGRKAHGWVHLVNTTRGLKIDHVDAYDEVDPELLRFVVATQGDAIIAAVRAQSLESRLAA
ncbi:MAG: hypothetical protein A3G25_03315 [Betaproteobacteria bacterium RIFCSPLOWO2_12_FULL_63_13]|nr:MAG: hypothetical protein A3H32_08780 [Betaproteobacteria bacterium RIFCSPLOWO2_02_FULL_63_19]OGA52048.1 MAG: hypothetical protein A3G25_03315 [Betaproteobacteria bacterium RIFCSPLOWO2_12_FULL_63_13]